MKNPDAVEQSLTDTATQVVDEREGYQLERGERYSAIADERERLAEAIEPWVRYGEYISIEIDTKAGTARVLPA